MKQLIAIALLTFSPVLWASEPMTKAEFEANVQIGFWYAHSNGGYVNSPRQYTDEEIIAANNRGEKGGLLLGKTKSADYGVHGWLSPHSTTSKFVPINEKMFQIIYQVTEWSQIKVVYYEKEMFMVLHVEIMGDPWTKPKAEKE